MAVHAGRDSGEVVTARGVVREAIREGDVLRVTCEVWSEKQDGTRVTDNGTAELEIEEYQPRP